MNPTCFRAGGNGAKKKRNLKVKKKIKTFFFASPFPFLFEAPVGEVGGVRRAGRRKKRGRRTATTALITRTYEQMKGGGKFIIGHIYTVFRVCH